MKHYPCVLTIAGSDCSGGKHSGRHKDYISIGNLCCQCHYSNHSTKYLWSNKYSSCTSQLRKGTDRSCYDGYPSTCGQDWHDKRCRDCAGYSRISEKFKPEFVVFDPVMVSTSGCKLMEDDAIEAITTLLMPLASIITPNLSETEVLTGKQIRNIEMMKTASRELLNYGCRAVLVKGGHLEDGNMCDVLQLKDESEPHLFMAQK